VHKDKTDWHTSDRMDHIHAIPSFGAKYVPRYDNVSVDAGGNGEVWWCKVFVVIVGYNHHMPMIMSFAGVLSFLGQPSGPTSV